MAQRSRRQTTRVALGVTAAALLQIGWVVLAEPGTAAPARPEAGGMGEYRDWIVGCDNVRTCRAIGFPADTAQLSALIVDRTGEPDGRPVLRLRIEAVEGARPENEPIEVASETDVLGTLVPGRTIELENTGTHWAGDIRDAELAAAILKTLRAAKELVLRRPGGAALATISLSGASAALLFMDDRQRRVGTQGALARPGDKPDAGIPAPPALPDAPAMRKASGKTPAGKPPAAVLRLHDADRRSDACNEGERGETSVARLGPALVLYGLPCWMGAYQGASAYYVFHESSGRAERLTLPASPARGEEKGPAPGAHILTGEGFDPETGLLSDQSKGRGLGDCGEISRWQWTGSAFVLVGATTMPRCQGLLEDWLDLHRTRPRE